MCLAFQIFLFTVLIQEKGVGNNYAQSETVGEKNKGHCEIALPLTRQRHLHPGSQGSFAHLASFERASFQRSSFSSQNRSSYGGIESGPMEMCRLSPNGQGECDVLPRLRTMVGDLFGSLASRCSTEHYKKQYVSRPSVCRRFLGWLAALGSDPLTESTTTATTASLKEIQGRLWWERRWKKQRCPERQFERQRTEPAQRLYGPGGHGAVAASADSHLT